MRESEIPARRETAGVRSFAPPALPFHLLPCSHTPHLPFHFPPLLLLLPCHLIATCRRGEITVSHSLLFHAAA